MRRPCAGWTLVELMIALVILAILATVAAPSFIELLQRQRVQAAAQLVVGDLQYARTEAQRRRAPVAFVAQAGASRYALTEGAQTVKAVELPDGVAIGTATVAFDPLRARTTAVQIDLGGRGKPWLRVRVAETGRTQVCSPDGKFGGMEVSDAKRLKALEDENAKLKRLLADAMLDRPEEDRSVRGTDLPRAGLKDLLSRTWERPPPGAKRWLIWSRSTR